MTKTSKKKSILVIHEPRTQHAFHLLDVDANYNMHPLLNYLPSYAPTQEQTPWQQRSRRRQVHCEDAAVPTPSIFELASKSIFNHRTDGLVKKGSKESLFSDAIVVAEVKMRTT